MGINKKALSLTWGVWGGFAPPQKTPRQRSAR